MISQNLRCAQVVLLIGAGLLHPATGGRAQDIQPVDAATLKALSLEELMTVKVVTATQVASDPFDLPFMTQAYTRSDYERMLPRTLPSWLQEVPGVMVQSTADGLQSPNIRGFADFRNLLLVDGIRVNNSVAREGHNQYWSMVDPLSTDSLEIVKGPSSVLYGSDSIGGTVNALSVGRKDYSPNNDADGEVLYRYGTAEDSQTVRGEASGNINEQFGAFAGATYKSFGEFQTGATPDARAHPGYDEYDVDAKVDYRFRPSVKLTLAHQTVAQDDVWCPDNPLFDDPRGGPPGPNPGGGLPDLPTASSADQQRHLTYLQLHATNLEGFVDEVHVSVSDQIQNEEQFRRNREGRTESSGTEVNTLGVWLQLQSETKLGNWVYGTSYYHDWVDSYSRKYRPDGSLDRIETQGPVADGSTYSLAGVYAQDQVTVCGPLDIMIQGRYDHAQADAGTIYNPFDRTSTSLSEDWDAFVGGGRASLHLGAERRWLLYAGVSQGFRAPNLSDLSRLDSVPRGMIESPATELEPEYYTMYEAGVKTRYARVEFEAAYFYTDIQGLIVLTPTGRTINGLTEVTKLNSSDGFIHGVEAQGKWRVVGDLFVVGAVTWMEGEVTAYPNVGAASSREEPVSQLMPLTGLAALRWSPPAGRFWAEASCTMSAGQDRLSSRDVADSEHIPPGGTPGYTTLTLRAGWRPCKNFTLSAVLENVTDEDYRIHGSSVNELGRNLILAGTLRF